MNSRSWLAERLRVFVVLGRVSNLPTVWSNCLAAWLLAGGGNWNRFVLLCAGATSLYTGGMYLNDAFDAHFDQRYRRERPIPRGQIGLRTVCLLAGAFLALGWFVLLPLGLAATIFASALLTTIVLYNAIHKRTILSPLLMATCRFLLYLLAASTAVRGAGTAVVWRAFALAAYITGLSYLARAESAPNLVGRWPFALLCVPFIVPIADRTIGPAIWLPALALLVWLMFCLRGFLMPGNHLPSMGRTVAGLLAGIVLVDWLAATQAVQVREVVFVVLFLLALISQRVAPAT